MYYSLIRAYMSNEKLDDAKVIADIQRAMHIINDGRQVAIDMLLEKGHKVAVPFTESNRWSHYLMYPDYMECKAITIELLPGVDWNDEWMVSIFEHGDEDRTMPRRKLHEYYVRTPIAHSIVIDYGYVILQ